MPFLILNAGEGSQQDMPRRQVLSWPQYRLDVFLYGLK